MVFSFSNTLNSCGVASAGTLTPGPNSNQCSVDVSAPTGQYITVQLTGVTDANTNIGNFSGTMGVLVGDTTANGAVNSSDISQTQSQSGQLVTIDNFREDVTVNGSINSSDIASVQAQSGTALPPPPPSSARSRRPLQRQQARPRAIPRVHRQKQSLARILQGSDKIAKAATEIKHQLKIISVSVSAGIATAIRGILCRLRKNDIWLVHWPNIV